MCVRRFFLFFCFNDLKLNSFTKKIFVRKLACYFFLKGKGGGEECLSLCYEIIFFISQFHR